MELIKPVALLRSSWSFFEENWKTLLSFAVLPFIISAIASVFFVVSGITSAYYWAIIGFVAYVAYLAVSVAFYPAITRLIHVAHSGDSEPKMLGDMIPEYYTYGFRMLWSTIVLFALAILVLVGSSILLFIPGVIMMVYISMYFNSYVIDGRKDFSALIDSYTLVKGRWWAVFWRMALLVGVCLGITVASLFVLSIILFFLSFVLPLWSIYGMWLIFQVILQACLMSLSITYIYKLFISLKTTRSADVKVSLFSKYVTAFLVVGIIVALIEIVGLTINRYH